MFPSGAALEGWFSLRAIKRFYGDLVLDKDERGNLEFAFKTKKIALAYFKRILKIGYFLQRNKDKIAMELMARVVDAAIKCGALAEEELWQLSERQIIERWDGMLEAVDGPQVDARLRANEARDFFASGQSLAMPKTNGQLKSVEALDRLQANEKQKTDEPCRLDFLRLYKTYRTMKKVRGAAAPLPGHFCVKLDVKRRWINPLVAAGSFGLANNSDASQQSFEAARRICDISARAKKAAQKFLAYNDTPYACVRLAEF